MMSRLIVVLCLFVLSAASAEADKSVHLVRSSSQYASIADGSQTGLDITGNITLEAWVKFDSLPSSGQEWAVVGKWGNAQDVGQSYCLNFYEGAGAVYIRGVVNDGADVRYIASAQLFSTDVWYHVAFSWRASDSSMKLYLNGSDTGATASGVEISSILNGDAPFRIGASDFSGDGIADSFFDGLITEVRVWNTVRTSPETLVTYNAEMTGVESGLVGYWEFPDNLTDATPNGNTLTGIGSPTFSSAMPYIMRR